MESKPAFSFAIKSKGDTGPLKSKSAIADDNKEDLEETDFVKSVDGTNIKSVKESSSKQKGPLVIPLIQKNNWRSASDSKKDESATLTVTSESDKVEDDLTRLAAKELIEAARRRENEDENDLTQSSLSIPLLLQNKVRMRRPIIDDDHYLSVSINSINSADTYQVFCMGYQLCINFGKKCKNKIVRLVMQLLVVHISVELSIESEIKSSV